MPLPNNPKAQWPPEDVEAVYERYAEHDAWYSGDPARLSSVYSGLTYNALTPKAQKFFSTTHMLQAADRAKFWAKRVTQERMVMLHVPLAGDIAATSADFLFSEPPRFIIPEAHSESKIGGANKTQELLDQFIAEDNVVSKMIGAAESAAALGGVFLKIDWDEDLVQRPILSVVQADSAVPEFRFGILTAVTFHRVVEDNNRKVWRHLERHEVVNGKATILHGLYIGDDEKLGVQVSLEAHPETAGLSDVIETNIEGLDVRYVPNRTPNRIFRGTHYGMSDYSGIEGLLDALDEVYTSWLRDIRLARARLVVAKDFLQKRTDGTMSFDVDQEIYEGLDMDPLTSQSVGITQVQFAIRTQEHETTALNLMERAITAAGYAPQSFGLSIDGRAESGTALRVRERKSFITQQKKQNHWQRPVEDMLLIALQLYTQQFGANVQLYRPKVEWSDTIMPDVAETSSAVESLSRAKAASMYTLVEMQHPDWTRAEIEGEVARIKEEQKEAMEVEDPMQIGLP